MGRAKAIGENYTSRLVTSLLLGTLIIFALVGCSGSATPTTKSEPVVTSAPAPAVITDPTSASQRDSAIGPIPTADVPSTFSALKPPVDGAFEIRAGQSVALEAPGGVKLSIPETAFDRDATINIDNLGAGDLARESPAGVLISDVYDIQLSDKGDLSGSVTITIPYDPIGLPEGASQQAVSVAWWDGETWRELPSDVDPETFVVTAEIQHFSKFAAFWSRFTDLAYDVSGSIRGLFFDRTYVDDVFTIHYASQPSWDRSGTRQLGDDRPPVTDEDADGVPDYVQLLGSALADARDVFDSNAFPGMTVPVADTIHVFVADLGFKPGNSASDRGEGNLGDADPRTSHIRIDNKLRDDQLMNTAAHELFHYWQFSRIWLLSGHKHRWWMEATAAWAMDRVFPHLNLYVHEIKESAPNPPGAGFGHLSSREVAEFYAASSLAKFFESRFPGFVMATFDTTAGLRLTESWQTTFARILAERYEAGFDDAFEDYLISYFYHQDYDEDFPLWFGPLGSLFLAEPSMIATAGMHEHIRGPMGPLSGRLINVKTPGDFQESTLVIKQEDAPTTPSISIFADHRRPGATRKTTRVRLPGDDPRRGLTIEPRPLVEGRDPFTPVVVERFGGVNTGAPITLVNLVVRNLNFFSTATLDVEIYALQSPTNVHVQQGDDGSIQVTWRDSQPPTTVATGYVMGYRIYRLGETAQELIGEVDASVRETILDEDDFQVRGHGELRLALRTVGKFGNMSPMSDSVTATIGADQLNADPCALLLSVLPLQAEYDMNVRRTGSSRCSVTFKDKEAGELRAGFGVRIFSSNDAAWDFRRGLRTDPNQNRTDEFGEASWEITTSTSRIFSFIEGPYYVSAKLVETQRGRSVLPDEHRAGFKGALAKLAGLLN